MAKSSNFLIDSMPIFCLLSFSAFLTLSVSSQLDCSNQQCGNLSNVRFPFSLNDDCPVFSPSFRLQCTPSQGRETPFLNATNVLLPVLHIFNDSLITDFTRFKATIEPQSCNVSNQKIVLNELDPFVFSRENYFGSFTCNSVGILITGIVTDWTESLPDYGIVGCAANCQENAVNNSCGNNCCADSLPDDVRSLIYSSVTLGNGSCEPGFSIPFYPNFTDFKTFFGLKVLWALPSDQNDTHAIRRSVDYACSNNSEIVLVSQVPGYLCRCQNGFMGDGYSNGSACTDINECLVDSGLNDCIHPKSCENLVGSYSCHCKKFIFSGDGKHGGSGCRIFPALLKALSITGGLLGAIIVVSFSICSFIFWRWRRRRIYFLQNGGLELQEYMSLSGAVRFFSMEELQIATQNFSEQLKLGVGGYGSVFQGTLNDGRTVAVKKANRPEVDNHQFRNEVRILMQINHRHIVRLLGCCLETATPLLVYEFVSNGTLLEHLNAEWESKASAMSGKDHLPAMWWRKRLQIASQTAEALAYLHAAASPPILHRDVKSSNILLDENMNAKVADFGVSRLVPDGVEQVSTAVQGTIGYLDPECFQTLQLTDTSDVYSLGVVLIEIITGMKPLDNRNREPQFANLALLFIQRMREGRLEELIDERLTMELEAEEDSRRREESHGSILEVARLARRCLALQGAQRPSMREVTEELRLIEKELAVGGEKVVAASAEEAEPLISLGKQHQFFEEESEAGAVVAANAQFYVESSSYPSSSTSVTSNSLLKPATPR